MSDVLTGTAARRLTTIGIDLGGTKIEGCIVDDDGQVRLRRRVPTERQRGYEHIVERTAALIADLRREAPEAAAVGVGTPGALSEDGRLKNSNTTCLIGRPLRADLAARVTLPLLFENDANCFALAEARAGAGRGHAFVFGVILGTGTGAGLVYRGELWRGAQRIAGEWGHHGIDPEGPACYCGRRGCTEMFLSGPAIERAYVAAGGEQVGASEVVARARREDARAAEVFTRYLDRFGRALANVINILDPSVVVLGGGLSNIEELYDRGRAAVERYVFNDRLETRIVRHALGDSAGVIGAAWLARLLAPPR